MVGTRKAPATNLLWSWMLFSSISYFVQTYGDRETADSGVEWAKLCPNKVPDMKYAPILYSMAQKAVGLDLGFKVESLNPTIALALHTFSSGGIHFPAPSNGIVSYVRIWKAGNNQVGCYFKEVAQRLNVTSKRVRGQEYLQQLRKAKCIITYIRDPLARFLSGYNEHEWRLDESRQLRKSTIHRLSRRRFSGGSFLERPLGNSGRFARYVHNVLSPKDMLHVLSEDYEVRHIFFMSGTLFALHMSGTETPIHFIPLESLSRSLPRFLQEQCDVPQEHTPSVPYCGQHNTTKDPLGTLKAAKKAMGENTSIARAVCYLIAMDYACFPEYLEDSLCSAYLPL